MKRKCTHKHKLYSQSVIYTRKGIMSLFDRGSIVWGWRCVDCGADYVPH